MAKIKFLILTGILLLGIMSFAAAAEFSNVATTPYTSSSSTFDSSMCTAGQDFIIQVSPNGCTPAVVRSDLLEEQDVPVFCPLVATQLNPLINVKSISSISFAGAYPSSVKSIGFYPAQAALSMSGQTQTNYPVLANIGYVVINLKQNQNESSMPLNVSGILTAKLQYSADNIFGVGNTIFYLPQMSDQDWQTQYGQYGFWNGKGFMRATDVESDSATIQFYGSNLNPTSTVNLKVGQTSSALSISGFSLCSASMNVKLNSIQPADTTVRLNVNGNEMNVVKGQPFLNNQCQVLGILTQGLTQDAQISCKTDSGKQTFDLRLSPTVTLNVNGNQGDYGLGDLITTSDGTPTGMPVYLGYIGTATTGAITRFGSFPLDKTNLNNLAIAAIFWPKDFVHTEPTLTNTELTSVANWIQSTSIENSKGKSDLLTAFQNIGKQLFGGLSGAFRQIVTGQYYEIVVKGGINGKTDPIISDSVTGPKISIVGFSQGQDQPLANSVNGYYQNATTDYQSILNSYPGEVYSQYDNTPLSQQAEINQIYLAFSKQQMNTLYDLCADFTQRYPQATAPSICSNGVSISSKTASSYYISINGQSYLITLESVYQPTYDDFGADISVRNIRAGLTTPYQLLKDQSVLINASNSDPSKNNNDFIQLHNLGYDTSGRGQATIYYNTQTITLTEGTPAQLGDGYTVTLNGINLKQFASVSITPTISQAGAAANFSFNVGIEKRNIQLTPDEIRQKIAETNKTISDLEGIINFTNATVNTLSQVCTYTGYGLFLKNFISNLLGGEGFARQAVMNGADGWYSKCSDPKQNGGKSVDQCLLDHSTEIDSEVSQMKTLIENQNTEIKNLQTPCTSTGSIFSQSVVDTSGFMAGTCKGSSTGYIQTASSAFTSSGIQCADASKNDGSYLSISTLLTSDNFQKNFFSVDDAKNIELYSKAYSSATSDSLKQTSKQQVCSILTNINLNSQKQQQLNALVAATGANSAYIVSTQQNVRELTVTNPQTFAQLKSKTPYTLGTGVSISDASYVGVVKDSSSGNSYLVVYGPDGIVTGTYSITGNVLSNANSVSASQTCSSLGLTGSLLNTCIADLTSCKGVTNEAGASQACTSFGLTGSLLNTCIANMMACSGNAAGPINPLNLKFVIPTSTSYVNLFKNPQVQYFEVDPYKGMPAIVPFDLNKGWYAAVQQNIPSSSALGGSGTTTATQSYAASGQVQSFYLCNVGPNGLQEFNSGIGDDQCESVNLATNQLSTPFPGLDSNQATLLVNQASNAIQTAARARSNNPTLTTVSINGNNIPVGQPATNSPSLRCTDFMSPSDCNILFNVCDPVVCPTSRCNFGGAYPVQDVVQTGVIGSILLCLPNSVMLGGSDYIPVCLPGIQSGLENWASVQKSYRDCLQANLDSGKTVGICDEMNSLYMCQFWWQQAQPLSGLIISGAASLLTGQSSSSRGGGEYLYTQNAMSQAQQSANYITQFYAANSAKAFQAKSTQNIGGTLCQNFLSVSIPGGAEIANSLSTVDSPPQYMGNFQEIPFTTATVPPTSQYKVYYHIYAGKNSGVYYSVYLQRSSSSSYYRDTSSTRQVDSGYLASGASADQTKDFTATSGYNQLCINVNGQVNCDFQQVSTSLALNYITDQYVANQANDTQVKTESECVSGTADTGALLNPNLQSGASNYLNPQIYNYGITRICATSNPGLGTDPNAGAQGSRWVQVGVCGNAALKCWLDTQSVKNAINSPDINSFLANGTTQTLQNATLQSVESNYMQILVGSGYLDDSQFASELDAIKSLEADPQSQIARITDDLTKTFYNNQKAYLLLLRGDAYVRLLHKGDSTTCSGFTCTSTESCPGGFSNPSTFCCPSTCQPLTKLLSPNVVTPASGTTTGTTATTGTKTITACPGTSYTSYQDCLNKLGSVTGPSTCSAACPGSTSGSTTTGTSTSNNDQIYTCIANGGTLLSCAGVSSSSITPDTLTSVMQNSQINCQCGSNCHQYATDIINDASQYNEDPLLLLSIIIQESNCMQTDSNGQTVVQGDSHGIMQVDAVSVPSCLSSPAFVGAVANDIYSDADKNIQCGALILNQKFTTYNDGKQHVFPVSGTCTSTVYYTGRDAAVRGYNGYGCGGDNNYVTKINTIYASLASLIKSLQPSSGSTGTSTQTGNTGSTATSFSTTGLAQSDIDQYLTYASLFDKYSQSIPTAYTTTTLTKNDFEALLIAIADQNNWGQSSNGAVGWLMNYNSGQASTKGASQQIASVSGILQGVLSGQIPSSSLYNTCISTQVMTDRLTCVLTVLNTQKAYSWGFFGIGASDTTYAKSVLASWSQWKSYLNPAIAK